MIILTNEFFKCLADQTRLRIMVLLNKREEVCECELSDVLLISQLKIARHLRYLKSRELILEREKGQWTYYRFNPELGDWYKKILNEVLIHMEDDSVHHKDLIRFMQLHSNKLISSSLCCP